MLAQIVAIIISLKIKKLCTVFNTFTLIFHTSRNEFLNNII